MNFFIQIKYKLYIYIKIKYGIKHTIVFGYFIVFLNCIELSLVLFLLLHNYFVFPLLF